MNSMLRVNLLREAKRLITIMVTACCSASFGQVGLGPASVTTWHNDNLRSGANMKEHLLTPSRVSTQTFGKVASFPVDGEIYAQPLVTPVRIGGQTHNLLIVCTEKNNVYAYDADSVTPKLYWEVNLGPPFYSGAIGTGDITPYIGILSTPVIDTTSNAIYVVAKTDENNVQIYRIHELSLATGHEMLGSPRVVAGSVPGAGEGGNGQTVTFNSTYHLNRTALLLVNHVLYVGFASHGDQQPYHGWIFAYQTNTLNLLSVYNTTPDGGLGGIWGSGAGMCATPAGDIVYVSGNGDFSHDNSMREVGNAIVRATPNTTGLENMTWFEPYNGDWQNSEDLDFGSAGTILLPQYNLAISTGKTGNFYVTDLTNMGGYNANEDSCLQSFPGLNSGVWGGLAYYQDSSLGTLIFSWAISDVLKEWTIQNGLMVTTPISQSAMAMGGYPGGDLEISGLANVPGTAIVWATGTLNASGYKNVVEGVLRAFDPRDLSHELYDSSMNDARDGGWSYAKFCPPTVANGKVYVPTFSDEVVVFGIRASGVGGD